MLPIPEAPLSYEGVNTENVQVSVPADFFLPVFDRIFPYAPDASADVYLTLCYALCGQYLILGKKKKKKKQDPMVPTHRNIFYKPRAPPTTHIP